ncbi:Zinc finger protein CONSTANS-LIKE 1 [Gracilariopsis chorda]|uniref:Zinc finger protein CONSTANS-LIKE 1 n=1 Tax=Gracilariopsis chorda TaxID=448386 RepID=A0A2V3J5T0_9FLOR|nr:Zinc finger protein CONSTANS-LIKE 1 [Gracilariopsis chorda]|eukprot:PXF49765.1 Zinc finger protein CONSTANS-LIKE 1 [Gracilariopsis chorda]
MSTTLCASCRTIDASVYCQADSAYLCTICDHSIHSANKLSRRHSRIPIHNNSFSPIAPSTDTLLDHSESSTLPSAETDNLISILPPGVSSNAFSVDDLLDSIVPQPNDDHLTSMAGAYVKKEAETLLQSSGLSLDAMVPQLDVWSGLHQVPQQPGRRSRPPTSSFDFSAVVPNMPALQPQPTSSAEPVVPTQSEASSTDDSESIMLKRKRHRLAALERFRNKRANRSFRKRVRYACRKQLADSRPRVKGRFVGRKAIEAGLVPTIEKV